MLNLVLAGLAGLFASNGVPHFVRGITHENYPSMLGNGPVANLVGGWICLVVAGALALYAGAEAAAPQGLAAFALGALLIGLFHASGRARGR